MALPEELRPAPGEGVCRSVYSRLIIPKAVKVLHGAAVGEDKQEAQELPVILPEEVSAHGSEGVGSAIPVGARSSGAIEVFDCGWAAKFRCRGCAGTPQTTNTQITPECKKGVLPLGFEPRIFRV